MVFFCKGHTLSWSSPDAIRPGEFIVEVKCLFTLKDIHPENFDELAPSQKKSYCLEKLSD